MYDENNWSLYSNRIMGYDSDDEEEQEQTLVVHPSEIYANYRFIRDSLHNNKFIFYATFKIY